MGLAVGSNPVPPSMQDLSGPWNSRPGCKDWSLRSPQGQLLYQWDASFKQIFFAVATDTYSGGRRIHVHEYPAREVWDNENMGILRQQYDVEGYVFGDDS